MDESQMRAYLDKFEEPDTRLGLHDTLIAVLARAERFARAHPEGDDFAVQLRALRRYISFDPHGEVINEILEFSPLPKLPQFQEGYGRLGSDLLPAGTEGICMWGYRVHDSSSGTVSKLRVMAVPVRKAGEGDIDGERPVLERTGGHEDHRRMTLRLQSVWPGGDEDEGCSYGAILASMEPGLRSRVTMGELTLWWGNHVFRGGGWAPRRIFLPSVDEQHGTWDDMQYGALDEAQANATSPLRMEEP